MKEKIKLKFMFLYDARKVALQLRAHGYETTIEETAEEFILTAIKRKA